MNNRAICVEELLQCDVTAGELSRKEIVIGYEPMLHFSGKRAIFYVE